MKQMAWLSRLGGDGDKVLHLNDGSGWVVYNSSPYGVPDYPIPKGSRGWATYQALSKTGEWVLIPSDQARSLEPVPIDAEMRPLMTDEWLRERIEVKKTPDLYRMHVYYTGTHIGTIFMFLGTWRRLKNLLYAPGHEDPMDAAIDEFREQFGVKRDDS